MSKLTIMLLFRNFRDSSAHILRKHGKLGFTYTFRVFFCGGPTHKIRISCATSCGISSLTLASILR